MDALSLTVQQMLDEAECHRLCVGFANHIDARRYDDWLNLFTDDATLDRMGAVVTGRAELAQFLASRSTTVETRHVCTNMQVDIVSADEATGMCYALFFQGVPGERGAPAAASGPPAVVEYHDRYRRTTQGWRIKERRIRMAIKP